ncbi:MAG: hypothetical protein L3J47_07360, partial [Sulfurovum sp.]|nr:hypothetical protein [Sulfurovum sp.]
MHHVRYLSGFLLGIFFTGSLTATPVLEHTGTIYRNIKNNTEMTTEKSQHPQYKKKAKIVLNQKHTVLVRGF